MGRANINIKGLKELQRDLDKMSKNLKNNKDKAEGNLSVDVGLIRQNLNLVNAKFSTSFNASSEDEEFINYFAEQYQEIMAEGIFESRYNPKEKFNSMFNPYSKIE